MSFGAPAQMMAPPPPAAPPPPPVFGQQAPTKSQKGRAQPTVAGAPPAPEQQGSKTLLGQ